VNTGARLSARTTAANRNGIEDRQYSRGQVLQISPTEALRPVTRG
jgi:hypothetical protein